MSIHLLGDKSRPCDFRGQTLVVYSRSKARGPGCEGRGYPREGPMLKWRGGTRWRRGSGMRFEPTVLIGNRSWRVFWTLCMWCLKHLSKICVNDRLFCSNFLIREGKQNQCNFINSLSLKLLEKRSNKITFKR